MTRKQYYILETETQIIMHYVSYVNHRRDFVEKMCFKNGFYMNIDTYQQRQRGRKRERELDAGRDKD